MLHVLRGLTAALACLMFSFASGAQPARAADGLSGVVTAADTGKPLAGVRVEVLKVTDGDSSGPVATARTGSDGAYAIPNVTAGDYVVGLSKPGYVTEYSGGENDPWQAEEIAVPGTYSGQLKRAAQLHGTLTDEHGMPVAAATVTATPAFHSSLASIASGPLKDGKYALGGLLPGAYTVAFAVDGRPLQYVPGQLVEARAQRYPLKAGANIVSDTLLPAPAGVLRGVIADKATGKPIDGACVELTAEIMPAAGGSACVGADGVYEFRGLASQSVTLFVSQLAGGYVSRSVPPFAVRDGDTVSKPVELALGGSLAGSMVEAGTGSPVAGALAVVAERVADGVSNAAIPDGPDATYAIANLPGGKYRLRLETVNADVPYAVGWVAADGHVVAAADGAEEFRVRPGQRSAVPQITVSRATD